jgi:hypothetical protein
MNGLNEQAIKDLILTPDKYFQRQANAGGIKSGLYFDNVKGDAFGEPVVKSNGEKCESLVVADGAKRWENSEGYANLWDRIEDKINSLKSQVERKVNIANFPSDYYDLIDMMRMDVTRRRMEVIDFTTMLTQERTNPAFSKSIALVEFMDYAGAFEQISGTNDPVPLLEQKTGAKDSVTMHLYGLGHVRTLEDELYNLDIFSMQKVNAAVTRGHRALRNNLSIGVYPAITAAGTWDAAQQQAADLTGATYDEQLYNTLRNAIRRLGRLCDYQTRNPIGINGAVLIVRDEVIAWDVGRVIRGQLAVNGEAAASIIRNVGPLPISEVWVYKGDRFDVGPKTYNYPGVPEGYAYLVIPGGATNNMWWTLVKRQLTSEVGRGDVLHLAREARAWYFGQTAYATEHFGNTGGLTGTDDYGYCVEIALPEEET